MADYPTHYPDGTRYLYSAMFGTAAERARDADRAVIARIGGNLYRERLADTGIARRSVMAEKDGWIREEAESLAAGLSYRRGGYSQPYHSIGNSQWDSPAVYHGQTHHMSARPDSRAMLPETAFAWPIYRAAVIADVYGALWGQASPAEERVLDTLAHCAGLRTSLRPPDAD